VKHYSHIDGLRAVAVLPVIFFHFNLPGVSGGYVGVDVFFVISGFLITGILFDMMQRKEFFILSFYERRARRILPALFVTCTLCLAMTLLLFVPDDFVQFSRSLEGVAGFASNFIFARWVGYFAASATVKPLLHTWSLAVEEQFYVFFPLLLYGLDRAFAKRRRTFTLSLYLLLGISLALNLTFISSAPERTFYLLHTRAWELMMGAVLMLHLQKIHLPQTAREVMGAAGAGLLLACFFLYDRNTVFPGAAAIPPCLATVALIWSNLESPTAVGRVLSSKPCVAVGLISYGLYLYHWPVLVFTRYYLDRDPTPAWVFFCLLLIGAMAIFSYRYVEKPIRSGVLLARGKSLFQFSAGWLLAFGLAGFWGVHSEGFPGRFSGPALQYAAGAQEKLWTGGKCPIHDAPLPSGKTVCTLGAEGRPHPDFLLWGDSHAGMLEPAIDAMARQYGVSGWSIVYAGCPSLVKTERADHYVKFSCQQIASAVFKIIKRNKIRTILLVTRWDMYALGWEKGSIETTREPLISFESAGGETIAGRQAFAPAVIETARALKDIGVSVWVMKQVPPNLVNVPSALAKAVYLGRDPEALRRPYTDIISRRKPIDDAFAEAAQAYPLHFIDPANKFCPGKSLCLIASEGHALYTDNSHLTIYGALWSKDMLTPFFQELTQ
jgi:peptidoglycan/LPS O-acetylase OafA/YrhL